MCDAIGISILHIFTYWQHWGHNISVLFTSGDGYVTLQPRLFSVVCCGDKMLALTFSNVSQSDLKYEKYSLWQWSVSVR